MRIFLDDERAPPTDEPDWLVVRSVPELLEIVSAHADEITEISFDNDLQTELEGRHALGRIVGDAFNPALHLPRLKRITVHSANVVAAEAMTAMVHAAVRHGQIPTVEIRRRSALEYHYPIDGDIQSSSPETYSKK